MLEEGDAGLVPRVEAVGSIYKEHVAPFLSGSDPSLASKQARKSPPPLAIPFTVALAHHLPRYPSRKDCYKIDHLRGRVGIQILEPTTQNTSPHPEDQASTLPTMKSLLALSLPVLALAAPHSPRDSAASPPSFKINRVVSGGSGCPQGSIDINWTNNGILPICMSALPSPSSPSPTPKDVYIYTYICQSPWYRC